MSICALPQLIISGVNLCNSVYVTWQPFLFQTSDNQNLLCGQGAVPSLAGLLCSPHYKVQMPSLRCLANMCFQNQKVSAVVATSRYTFSVHSAYISRIVRIVVYVGLLSQIVDWSCQLMFMITIFRAIIVTLLYKTCSCVWTQANNVHSNEYIWRLLHSEWQRK